MAAAKGTEMDFIIVSAMLAWVLAHPAQYPPYKGEDRYGHAGWWNGAEQPHVCPTGSRQSGLRVCGGIHYRYYLAGHGYVGGYGEGNDPCRANPWDRNSAWVCK
jgi:hypothetical protein